MPKIRVPFTTDPLRREKAFHRLSALITRFGSVEGTVESGQFRGSTPIGGFAGSYRSIPESGEIEVSIDKKPLLVSMGMIESELRKVLNADAPSVA